jgi:hypothetical protein
VLEFLRSSLLPTSGASVMSTGDTAPRGDLDSEPVSVINEGAPSADTMEYPEGEGIGVSKPLARAVAGLP